MKDSKITLTEIEDERKAYVIKEYPSGFLLLADKQIVPVMCIFRAKIEVEDITDLTDEEYSNFARDFREALIYIKSKLLQDKNFVRLNWDKLDNELKKLHMWIIPRYKWEGDELSMPLWTHNMKERWEKAKSPSEELIQSFKN
ncbi:MAG: hypothetical protein COY69_01135 [Candidatus Magasanikbacteria bacterium CG_4_10_14_0_8_um_filter_32_14]|uniref:HIT domain-containing protein n=1 Tax=Candidatus Magasanikbacteria bacterium CG_4_10_14_0_8_um_filter_32_14 TaxID=1974640 RepID=A0A2M7RB15_9BACT|nr:MAG: hypothetical protein COY69_01135 [Candidatus Magasanikbacteria bacterium CG_4_10_14_0_8_um_filter_32_14]